MSDTPISDSTPHNVADLGMRIRMIERDLTASNAIIRQQQLLDEANLRLQERIKRLEAAGDRMASLLKSTRQHWYSTDQCEVVAFDWNEAKEAKL